MGDFLAGLCGKRVFDNIGESGFFYPNAALQSIFFTCTDSHYQTLRKKE
jgi:hypothetical protein